MKLRNMFLCDAASSHPDNTFSALRGGIDTLNIPCPTVDTINIPPVNIALVATIELEITEMGRLHNLEVAFLDFDGRRIIPDLRAHFQTPVSQKKGRHNVILNISIPFKKPGTYGIYLNVDGHELGYHPVQVNNVEIKKG